MRPTAAKYTEQCRNGLRCRVAGHGTPIIAETGNPITSKDAFHPMVVHVARPSQDKKIAEPSPLAALAEDFPSDIFYFTVFILTFPNG